MKKTIRIVNNRNLKVLGGGLPSFIEGIDTYASVEEAARAIKVGAYSIIDEEATVYADEHADYENARDDWNGAYDEYIKRVEADIIKYELWEHDGVTYFIVDAMPDDAE